MKKIVLVAVLLLLVLAWAGPARSLEGISRDEVIEEAARLTGLSKDTMELLYDETPSLFENIERVAFTIKVTNLFVNARDNEAILELFNRFIDELRSALLPKNLNTFLTAVNVYRTSLEVIRDYVFIPKMDEAIYQRYRSMRLEDLRKYGDTSGESQSTAFEAATTAWGSGYYVVRDTMYRELLKNKGYNENLLGDKFKKYLRSQIDQFWMSALELRLEKEILAENEEAVKGTLWEEVAEDLKSLYQEALRRQKTPAPTAVSPLPTSGENVSEEAILAEFRKLYPQYIQGYYRTTPRPWRIELIANAEKVGENQYRLAYKLWQVVQEGPEKGKEYVGASFEAIRTLEEIKSAAARFKEELGQEH